MEQRCNHLLLFKRRYIGKLKWLLSLALILYPTAIHSGISETYIIQNINKVIYHEHQQLPVFPHGDYTIKVQNKITNTTYDKDKVKESIVRWAIFYGQNPDTLLRVAYCESGYNPYSVNKNYYDNGNPTGLFQHISGYWEKRAARYGSPGASIYDYDAQAKVTAAMFKDGQSGAWECK
jgi:hypothetical protein